MVHKRTKYYRSVFSLAKKNIPGYARVRYEDKFTTITTKIYNNKKFPDEYEVTIKDDFQTGVNLLLVMGLKKKAYQESYRTKWILPKYKDIHEITIDELPGIPPYMEIDCKTKKALNEAIKLFDVDKEKMRKGSFDKTYAEYYGMTCNTINNKIKSLTFKNILNELGSTVKKNEELLKKISKKQKKY